MRRATLTTGERADNLEQGKRLKKHVNECVRRANTALQEAGTLGALFSAAAVGVRAKLREACERVILMFPGSQDHQVEETLWRKVYYQPLHSAKEMRKGNSWSTVEAYWVCSHLWDGVAFYHSLLHSLAAHASRADFLPHQNNDEEDGLGRPVTGDGGSDTVARCLTCLGDLTRYMLDLPSPPPYRLSVRYYLQALHYLPDGGLIHSNLATVYSVNDQPLLAVAHYLRALTCEKIFEGAEGNLKRLLGKSRSFYGSSGEDQGGQTPADHHKMFLHTVLTLTACFINNRSTEEIARLCQDVLVQLGKALETYDDVDNEVPDRSPSPHTSANGHHTSVQNGQDSSENTNENVTAEVTLTPEVMVVVCTVLSLCTKRLEKQGSSHTSMAQALMVSVLMTLISHVSSRLEQRISLIDPAFLSKLIPEDEKKIEEENKKGIDTEETNDEGNSDLTIDNGNAKKTNPKKSQRTKKLANLRRRRLRVGGGGSSGSQDEDSFSDASGSEEESKDNEEAIISSEDEGEEEELDLSQLCSSEDDDSDDDVKIESDQEWEGLSAGEHLELISKESMLSAVFVACDWMKREEEVIQLCVKTANSLWTAMAKLLNLLRVDLEQLKNNSVGVRSDVILILQESEQSLEQSPHSKLVEALKITPLPEDLMLHTLIPTYISGTHKALNLKTMELVLLRTRRLSNFGREITVRQDTPLWQDAESGQYSFSLDRVVSEEKDKNKKNDLGITSRESSASPTEEDLLSVPPAKRDSRRLAGMQSLTAQWLQHEVRSLEERTRRATLGLYLVPDASVLINHLPAIQLLLSKPTHMIIIPQAVIGLLDQQKRESLGARNAIRWLEIKFCHGSRFIRSQRPHERTHLPLIKYPKRKDKEAWEWYQIVECCNYLSAQVQQNSNSVKTATVTLLTGEKNLSGGTFSHSGLTQAAGAVLEHIEEFMSKWHTSTKGHS